VIAVTAGHPIVVRRAEPGDAEGIHQTFLAPRAIAGTLQLPYPSVESWRKRITEFAPDDYLLVATIAGEVVGNLGLHAASKSPRRRHVGAVGMAVRDDCQRRGVGTALMRAAIELADGWLNYQRLELTVYTDNLAALQLYRKFDFAIEGTCKAYAFRDGCFVDAYAMARLHPILRSKAALGIQE
jgi:putative acetyltransferase